MKAFCFLDSGLEPKLGAGQPLHGRNWG